MDQSQIGIEGVRNLNKGANDFASLGTRGQVLCGEVIGKYASLADKGLIFVAPVAAAAAVPIATTLTNAPALWNPASSGKYVYPLRVVLSLGAIGTPILNGFTISYLKDAGDNIGTGAPVVTWTNVAPTNALIGKGTACKTKFSPAVSTYTTQPARLMDLGFGHHLEGSAASGQLYSQFYYDFDGGLVMPPGTTIHLGSTIATSTTYWTTFIFAELPAPLAAD